MEHGMNGNGFHRLIYLSAWSPVVWKGLEGVALTEEVCHWGWGLRFQNLTPFSAPIAL